MRSMRKSFVHPRRVEIPDRGPAHDKEAKRAEDGEVDGGVELLHKSVHLTLVPYAKPDRKWTNESLHEELAGKGKNDGVEDHEGEVLRSFAILRDIADVRGKSVGALVERRVGV